MNECTHSVYQRQFVDTDECISCMAERITEQQHEITKLELEVIRLKSSLMAIGVAVENIILEGGMQDEETTARINLIAEEANGTS